MRIRVRRRESAAIGPAAQVRSLSGAGAEPSGDAGGMPLAPRRTKVADRRWLRVVKGVVEVALARAEEPSCPRSGW
jgi:hypothetical protein